jgi:RimJ/RimL family protein N-acetyltransferase
MKVNHPSTVSFGSIMLKSITLEHVSERYLSWLNDPQVTQGIITKVNQYNLSNLREYVEKVILDDSTYMFAIHDVTTDLHIGNIKLYEIHRENKTCGLGLLIGDKTFWGRGVGTDACNALADFAFETLKMRKIWLTAFCTNPAAVALYHKVGFEIEGTLKQHVIVSGVCHDEYFMALFPQNRKK